MNPLIVIGGFVLAIAGVLPSLSGNAWAGNDAPRVAIVEDYSDPRDSITIDRAGNALRLALGTELFASDQVNVAGDGYVVLRFNSGSERVDASNSPFLVADQSGPLQDLSANFDRVLSVIAWWDESSSDEPMRSRDGVPPTLPALERIAAPRILATARVLLIDWKDGKGPFEVQFLQDGVAVAAASTEVGVRNAELAVALEAGVTYRLELIDRGREGIVPTSYEISATDTLPATSVSIPEDDTLYTLLQLAELAATERGRWAFEALQQLKVLPEQSRFRSALIEAIAHGDHP